MTAQKILETLGEWKGYRVGTSGPAPGDPSEVWIELIPHNPSGLCSGCGACVASVHESTVRWIRDLPVFGKTTWLVVARRRLCCPTCGPKLEALDWIDPLSRHTRRFEEAVARLCKVATHKHVAVEYGINRKSVKSIEKRYLQRTLGPVSLEGVRLLAMDGFAIQKGHRYATVIVDPTCKKVLWIGRGRSRAAIHPFFELLGEEGCRRIRAVAMDMNSSYEQEVWEHCPDADVVYDLFHVVAKYGREVVDRVRVDEANRLAGYIKGILSHARWPLHTSLLEGINNKIKVLKRMAYGYRDDEFFFLKIRQAFPGNGT
jgi:transposase